MKGTIFVELLAMAESAFGEEVVDEVLDNLELESGGAFTAVGNYPCEELFAIVMGFSAHSGLSPDALQRQFGFWMLEHFEKHYPEFFAEKNTAFDLLEAVDGEIHVEVRKLYPEAELPRFDTKRPSPTEFEMVYSSARPLASFCHGMIEASLARFDESATIERHDEENEQNATRFQIRLTEAQGEAMR